MNIGVDIVSGEKSPRELFSSLQEYSRNYPEEKLFVFIDKETIESDSNLFQSQGNLLVIPVKDKIVMEDNPIKSLEKKKDSSIVKGLEYLKAGKIDFFFSPGNTGAVVYGAYQIIGLVKEVTSPAIGVLVPNIYGDVFILDVGASPLIDENRAWEMAMMGKVFYENFFSVKDAPVGIMNVGKEWYKGPKWVRKTDMHLKKEKNFHYYGFVEGFDLFTSTCRVFITGGYTGNILLKGLEGVYYYIKAFMQKIQKEDLIALFKNQMHYSRVGAGIVLGLKKDVFIGHGITDGEALKSALLFAKKVYVIKLSEKITAEIKNRSFMAKILNRRAK